MSLEDMDAKYRDKKSHEQYDTEQLEKSSEDTGGDTNMEAS